MTALLLIAHGSRRAEANDELRQIAEALRARGEYPFVTASFLELAAPSIPEGAAECVRAGAADVIMLPYFLSPGRHVADDLETFRRQFETDYANVRFTLAKPLGRHPLMMDIILQRAREAGAT